MTNTVAIIQARMGSTRFPGKVLADLCGAPVLSRVITRTSKCRDIDRVVVATSLKPADDAVEEIANSHGIMCVRGSEEDVLSRYVLAAEASKAEVVVRITADCPLVDPGVISEVLLALRPSIDFASNALHRTYPRGLDAEAFYVDVLHRVNRMARSPNAREHVTYHIYAEAGDLFAIASVKTRRDHSLWNWCVDEPADIDYLRRIIKVCGPEAGWEEILDRRAMWAKRSVA